MAFEQAGGSGGAFGVVVLGRVSLAVDHRLRRNARGRWSRAPPGGEARRGKRGKRTGIRRGELLDLTVDAVVQIGSAYWLRIPIGKLHNDRYIPLHPQLKDLLDDWITHHRPAGLRTERLLIERNRPITAHRVARALTPSGRTQPASATSPPTNSATPWPPKPSTAA